MRNYTHIVALIDRSGSMASIKSDAEGGVNSFVQKQKEVPGKASLDIYDFDTEFVLAQSLADVNDFKSYSLQPRGSTAMNDAICMAIDKTGEKLAKMDEKDRPSLLLFVIVTDGQENASRTFTHQQVKDKIKHQTDVYKWQFSFLCNDPTVAQYAVNSGMLLDSVAEYKNVRSALHVTGGKFAAMRSVMNSGASMDTVYALNAYTKEDKEEMQK